MNQQFNIENGRLTQLSKGASIGQGRTTPLRGVDPSSDCKQFSTTVNIQYSSNAADDLSRLIAQAEYLYQNDEPRTGQHFIILMALHELDFKRRRFGPRFGDASHKPVQAVTP